MFKRSDRFSKNNQLAVVTAAVTALLAGAAVSTLDMMGVVNLSRLYSQHLAPVVEAPLRWRQTQALTLTKPVDSAVKSLIFVSVPERAAQLERLATDPDGGEDRNRARYLLASDLIQQGKAGSAIAWLDQLEADYDILAPYVRLRRAQAYTAMGETEKAKAVWQEILQQHDQHPVAAEALYTLGKTDRQYWQQALETFPAHPRSVEIAQLLLKEKPADPLPLLQILARHGLYLPDIVPLLDTMVAQYSDRLEPEDWEAIGFGYWEKLTYEQAGDAYSKAPPTPVNAYRAARSLQIGQRREDAIAAYRRLNELFPDAPENADGLLKLAAMLDKTEALPILDQIIERFPGEKAAEALSDKAALLEELGSSESASQARQSILSQYSHTEAAARLRWMQAKQHAKKQDYRQAWDWARQIPDQNPESDLAPEAAFWIGKWASRLGQSQDAQTAFKYVISHYPESYYAWRSAVGLGWNVGDFKTVRDLQPRITKATRRSTLPAGSETLQELYQLGQEQEAWTLWQVEFENPMEPTVAEQFTDGIIRLGVGDNLDGIFMVSSLAWRDRPEEAIQYKTLARQDLYWQALYPFPFENLINNWSQQRQLNPLLVTALIRQESRFEPQIESVVGAKGLMQVMPETASWIGDNTGFKTYNLAKPEDNIRLGTWYLDYTHQEYSNHSLFAVASYNAGPGNVSDWIKRYNYTDADEFVNVIPFPETQNYVKSVFGGYWNYLRLYNPEIAQRVAKYTARQERPSNPL